jgi:hypothetical protein
MAARLKYVDPTRPRGAFSRAYARFSGTRLARFISAKVVWKLDPYLLRATFATAICSWPPWPIASWVACA